MDRFIPTLFAGIFLFGFILTGRRVNQLIVENERLTELIAESYEIGTIIGKKYPMWQLDRYTTDPIGISDAMQDSCLKIIQDTILRMNQKRMKCHKVCEKLYILGKNENIID